MQTVGVSEAKTHLSELLARVAQGERFTITKHGVPVAMLVPVVPPAQRGRKELIAEVREVRKGSRLGGLTIGQLRKEGRRF